MNMDNTPINSNNSNSASGTNDSSTISTNGNSTSNTSNNSNNKTNHHNKDNDNKDQILHEIEDVEAEYLKKELLDLQYAVRYKDNNPILVVFIVFLGLVASIMSVLKEFKPDLFRDHPHSVEDYVVAAISITCSAYYGYHVHTKINKRNRLRFLQSKLLDYSINDLKEQIQEDFFNKLVDINFKYLDKYYLQTQIQAAVSFKVARNAAVAGFAIICFGILMMFFEKTDQAYVTTAAGLISEAIAAIFYYLYNRTILKMSQYHQKLVITQNISLALKTTESMDKESKQKALTLIIDRLTTDVNKHLSEK